jgi:dCMP deaminase
MNSIWDRRFLELAKMVSTWSKDPHKKVGTVIIDDKRRIKGLGYNGFPAGVADSEHRLNDKSLKLMLMVHAEINALFDARGLGVCIYTYPCLPCTQCLGAIQRNGIKRIVSLPPKPGTKWDPELVINLAEEMGIEIVIIEDFV